MIAACEKSNTKLLINHPRRFHPVFQMAKELINEGAIGEIKMVECFGYGKLMHNGSHAFDVLADFFGPAQWVQGELIETDDKADPDGRGFVKMQNGVTALVDFASIQPFTFTFRGDGGALTIDQFEEGLEVSFTNCKISVRAARGLVIRLNALCAVVITHLKVFFCLCKARWMS